MYDRLHEELLKREVLHADETTLQALHEPGKTARSSSYMWLYRTKTYYNFSILFPVNEEFINHASMDIQFNGLMDIILLDASKEEIASLSEVIKDNLVLSFKEALIKSTCGDLRQKFSLARKESAGKL